MANKHLKKNSKASPTPEETQPAGGTAKHVLEPEPAAKHTAPEDGAGKHVLEPGEEVYARRPEEPAQAPARRAKREKRAKAPREKRPRPPKKTKKQRLAEEAEKQAKAQEDQAVAAVLEALSGGAEEPKKEEKHPIIRIIPGGKSAKKAADKKTAPKEDGPQVPGQGGEAGTDAAPAPEKKKDKKPVAFRRDKAEKTDMVRPGLSRRDAVGAIVALVAALVLLAATVVVWLYRDSFSPDGMILSTETAAVPEDEYEFDAGSGEAFAAAGRGLAVANASGLELLDGEGAAVTSKVMQMETPAAAGCADFAVFYDLGGTRLAVARFDGTVQELDVPGAILSATVSPGGFIALTTEYTGYRALVTVYDPMLNVVYEWYSSSAWIISAAVSPDGRHLAALGYTASGSEVRFFDLSETEQQAAFSVADTVLLDMHWFSSDRLCALSSEQALFFGSDGEWTNTYTFAGQYLVGYTFDGNNCAAFALSPYRAGTTATLVSLDPAGALLGTAEVDSEIVCLTASDLEIMVLCSDGAVLYNSSLTEKGRLNGLPGFKYGLLRSKGEALLIASNYAEVYTF